MRKKILPIILFVCIIAVLFSQSLVAYAKPPMTVSGTFDYTFEITDTREANGNLFVYATEDEVWTGDFEGTAQAVFRVGMFRSGFWNVWLRSTFTGTVLGKEGTLVIQLVGKKLGVEDWNGHWVIISGTGELEGLRGRGTWWGPGFDAPGPDIYYAGKVHFEPN